MTKLDRLVRAAIKAGGENPDAYHTKAAYGSGAALADHAIPLWRQQHYRRPIKVIIAEIRAIAEEGGPLEPWVYEGARLVIDGILSDE